MQDSVGLGIDIVEIARMDKILERTPSFRDKVFSEDECVYCEGKAHPATHYAARFAAKEAVLKALGTGFSEGIGVRDIEVCTQPSGRPVAKLYGRAAAIAAERGVNELPLSLSYTHNEAVACAMALTEARVSGDNVKSNPTENTIRQFKKMRGFLDDLPSAGIDESDETTR